MGGMSLGEGKQLVGGPQHRAMLPGCSCGEGASYGSETQCLLPSWVTLGQFPDFSVPPCFHLRKPAHRKAVHQMGGLPSLSARSLQVPASADTSWLFAAVALLLFPALQFLSPDQG